MRPLDINREDPEWDEASTLLGAYLHEDFVELHGSARGAVRDFARASTTEQRHTCARALRRLVELFDDDRDLSLAAERLGSAYYPQADGWADKREWLIAVADYLESPESGDEPTRGAPTEHRNRALPKQLDTSGPEWAQVRLLLGVHLADMDVLGAGGAWGGVTGYLLGNSAEERRLCARSLRRLVADFPDDHDLAETTALFGMEYDPTADGYSSYRRWLIGVADVLEDPDATGMAPPERDAPPPRREGEGGRYSTFTDRHIANRAMATNLRLNRRGIAAWMRTSTGPNQPFEYTHSHVVGRLAPPDATLEMIRDVERSRVVLAKDRTEPQGWSVVVAYPVATVDPHVARSIDRTASEWQALWSLLGGYLHQDFETYGGAWRAVAAFETDAGAEERAAAAAGIRRLLVNDDEHHLMAATEWLGMDYHPVGDGWTYRSWLSAVAAHLER